MTNEEAIRIFQIWIERDSKLEYCDREENIELYKMAIKALGQTNTAEWIFCKDRLPEVGQRVLVSLRRYNYRKGEPKNTRRSDRFSYKVSIDTWTESNCFQRNPLGIIIAWQPLPEPLIQEKSRMKGENQ